MIAFVEAIPLKSTSELTSSSPSTKGEISTISTELACDPQLESKVQARSLSVFSTDFLVQNILKPLSDEDLLSLKLFKSGSPASFSLQESATVLLPYISSSSS